MSARPEARDLHHRTDAVPPVPPVPVASRGLTRRALVAGLLLATAALLLWYGETAWSIALIWERAPTYSHGFLVLPLVGYLIWRRRAELLALPVRPAWSVLPLIALAAFAWVLGNLGGVLGLSQFALVAMLPLLVWLAAGHRIAWAILFPLAFTLFAVPLGEFIVPVLMEGTATATVSALRVSGIPVFRDGMHFVIPSGSWSVIDACSGIRYLIASIMVGSLFAYLAYRSAFKRILFTSVAIVVPILANWLRAYLIVLIAHLSDNRLATGVDHIWLGWGIYGVVMGLVFWIGMRWADAPAPSAGVGPSSPAPRAAVAALAGGLLVAAMGPVAAALLPVSHGIQATLEPLAPAAGWTRASMDRHILARDRFLPAYEGARATRFHVFTAPIGDVAASVQLFADQTQGQELINSGNVLVTQQDRRWYVSASEPTFAMLGDVHVPFVATRLTGVRHQRMLVWHTYWINGRWTTNEYVAKAWQVWSQLTGHGDAAALVTVQTAMADDVDGAAALRLAEFFGAHGEGLEALLARAGARAVAER